MVKMSLLHHYDVIHAPTTYKSTSNLAQSLQSAMKPISPAQQDHIISLLNSGLSMRSVASRTGVSKSKVSKRCSLTKRISREDVALNCPLGIKGLFSWKFSLAELKMQLRLPKISTVHYPVLFLCKPSGMHSREMTLWQL